MQDLTLLNIFRLKVSRLVPKVNLKNIVIRIKSVQLKQVMICVNSYKCIGIGNNDCKW